MRPVLRLWLSLGVLLGLVPLALLWGENGIDLSLVSGFGMTLPRTHSGLDLATEWAIIEKLRWPRVIAAISVGSCLALAGVVVQNLFKNSLADPYILGVSSGAALSYLLAATLGLSLPVVLASLTGALLALGLLLVLSWRQLRHMEKVLLNGVMLSFGFSALISIVLVLSKQTLTHSLLFWLMGDLSQPSLRWWPLVVVLVILSILKWQAAALDVLARGNRFAEKTGVSVMRLNVLLLLLAATLVAVAVSVAGPIGFVGLMVPHLSRRMVGFSHRYLLPAVAIHGAILVLVADTLARTVAAPVQLPAGAITALMGVAFFGYLQRRADR